MRAISNAIVSSLLLAALALAGCGGGGASSQSATASIPSASIPLESPVLVGTTAIPARYTCDGKDVSLPLQWTRVPVQAKELILVILALTPVRVVGSRVRERFAVDWAVAGLRPSLHRLDPGRLPPGAILGRNAHGHSSYSICPAKGTRASYLIGLFAPPSRLSPRPGFSDESLFAQLSRVKPPYGRIFATYSRA